MSHPHLTMPVMALGPTPAYAIAGGGIVVVAVHGRGQEPAYMVDNLIDRVAPALTGPVAWQLPVAADNTWYPTGFLAPFEQNQPSLDGALAALDAMAARLLADDIPEDRIVWAGFSQGACLVSEWVARHPRRWGGLMAFTGGRIGPSGTDLTVHGSFAGMPSYFGVGEVDEWVPEPRVTATAEAYRAAGADVTEDVFAEHVHEISDAEIVRAIALLNSV